MSIFNLGVFGKKESSGKKSKANTSETIAGASTATGGFVGITEKGPVGEAVLVNSFAQYQETFGGHLTGWFTPYAVEQFFTEGGAKCYVVRTVSHETTQSITIDALCGNAGAQSGLYALDAIGDVNMIAMPDIHLAATPDQSATAIRRGVAYCENRKDCFFIADTPAGKTPQEALGFKKENELSSSYAALYYPWVNATFGGKKVLMPPSAAVMGMISRTDTNRGVFKAPAGVIDGKLRSVSSLEVNVSHKEQEDLNPYGVNVIRNFAGPGNVVWGARTCASGLDAEWQYINVRRYFIYVEKSLPRIIQQQATGEPNTPDLWEGVKRNITAFLTNEWRNGALFGSTPEEAFYVTVDSSNSSPEAGELNIETGIAPVKPAEFVIIRISQKTQSS